MTRRRLAWLPFVVITVGAAVWLYPPLARALEALGVCAGGLALLGAVCLAASWVDKRVGRGGE